MPFRTVLNQRDLKVLRTVFDAHCQQFGISSKEGCNSVAASLMVLYQNGISDPEDLLAALDREERAAEGPRRSCDFGIND